MPNRDRLSNIANQIRKRILRSAWMANGGHIAPAYSMVEIVVSLYFDGVLRYDASDASWQGRDYFILSKGHGALALYSALAIAGFFPESLLDGFCKPGSDFGSLARAGKVPGVEATTGSLGHGLPYAVGISLANKMDGLPNKTYVLVGDGECEEGSIWEALMSAAHYRLDNMVIIMDHNGLQAMDGIEKILSFDNIVARMESFGLKCVEINGHDFDEIRKALKMPHDGAPLFIVANTVKGRGISFMENEPIWHYRIPDDNEIEVALAELGMTREELGEHENSLFRNII